MRGFPLSLCNPLFVALDINLNHLVMKRLYIFIFGAMLTMQASADNVRLVLEMLKRLEGIK